MKTYFILAAILTATNSYASSQFGKLSPLFGAMSAILAENTKVPNLNEKALVITPDAENTKSEIENDLEGCVKKDLTAPQVIEVEANGMSFKSKKFHLVIEGPNCPLRLEAGSNANQTSDSEIKGNFFVNLKFLNQQLVQKYQMTFLNLNGDLNGKVKQNPDGSLQMKAFIDINSTGNGTQIGDFSQALGLNIAVEFNMSTFQLNMLTEQTGTIKYANVQDKLYSRGELQGFTSPKEYFEYNGKEISKSEYQKMSESFIIPGLVNEDSDQNSPDGKTLSACRYLIYEKNLISEENLKSALKGSAAPQAGLVNEGKVCGKNQAADFTYNETQFKNELIFDQNWIVLNGSYLTKNEPSSIYVLYRDSEPIVSETDAFFVGLTCKPVIKCD
jgi:hypothetical protein